MSAVTFETLLRVAFGERYDDFFSEAETTAYTRFDRASIRIRPTDPPNPDLSFAFERVRLAVAMALLQLLVDLHAEDDGDAPDAEMASSETAAEAAAALRVLHQALLEARSPQDIDALISQEAKVFERLYTDLYVDDDSEQVMLLFERTLAADTRRELDRCLREAAALAEDMVE